MKVEQSLPFGFNFGALVPTSQSRGTAVLYNKHEVIFVCPWPSHHPQCFSAGPGTAQQWALAVLGREWAHCWRSRPHH